MPRPKVGGYSLKHKASKQESTEALLTTNDKTTENGLVSRLRRRFGKDQKQSPDSWVSRECVSASTSVTNLLPGDVVHSHLHADDKTDTDSAYDSVSSSVSPATSLSTRSQADDSDGASTSTPPANLSVKPVGAEESWSIDPTDSPEEKAEESQQATVLPMSDYKKYSGTVNTSAESLLSGKDMNTKGHFRKKKNWASYAKPVIRCIKPDWRQKPDWRRKPTTGAGGRDESSDPIMSAHSLEVSLASLPQTSGGNGPTFGSDITRRTATAAGIEDVEISSLTEEPTATTTGPTEPGNKDKDNLDQGLAEESDEVNLGQAQSGAEEKNAVEKCENNKCGCKARSTTSLSLLIATTTTTQNCDCNQNLSTDYRKSISSLDYWPKSHNESLQTEVPIDPTVEITKVGKDCTWEDINGTLFEEVDTPSRFSLNAKVEIVNIGRNTWINQDDIVFEKLPYHHQQLWTRSEHTTEPAEPQSPLTTNRQTSPSEDGCIEVDTADQCTRLDDVNVISSDASFEKGEPRTSSMKKTLPVRPVFIDQNRIPEPVHATHPQLTSQPSSSDPITITPETSFSLDDTPDSMVEPEQLREDVSYSRLSEVDLDEVINNLQRDESRPTMEAEDLEELMNGIANICSTEPEVKAPMCTQDPRDPYRLLLQGPKLGLIKDEILQLIEEEFSAYRNKVIVSDKSPNMVTAHGLPIYTRHLAGDRGSSLMYLTKETANEDQSSSTTEKKKATCGVYFCATGKGSRDNIFAVTAGHSLLTHAQCLQIASEGNKQTRKKFWKSLVGETATESHLSLAPNNKKPVNTTGIPFVNYRHHVPGVGSNSEDLGEYDNLLWHEKFMADEFAIQINKEDLKDNLQEFFGRLQRHVAFSSINSDTPQNIKIGGILKIKDPKDLVRLRNVRVSCAGIPGVIRLHSTTIKGAAFQMGHHVAFDTEAPLLHGTSGSPVFVYDEVKNVMYYLAILVGVLEGDESSGYFDVYQATPLSPILARLENLFSFHMKDISLIGPDLLGREECKVTSQRLRQRNSDSGFVSLPTSPTPHSSSDMMTSGGNNQLPSFAADVAGALRDSQAHHASPPPSELSTANHLPASSKPKSGPKPPKRKTT